MAGEEIKDLMARYKERLEKEFGAKPEHIARAPPTKEYAEFREEILPKHMGYYEKACAWSDSLLKIKPDPKKEKDIQKSIDMCHLDITPAGAAAFSFVLPILVIVVGSLLSFLILNSMFFVAFFLLAGIAMIIPLQNMPDYMANAWRMKASNQMVLCIFYVVTFMRHTSNIELAIEFASDHLSPPLSLDLKKVLWDVETAKYESVKESLDMYLGGWRKHNMEFVESFHLIEASLYEGSEDRRLTSLDKSLDVILSETYEKMLHYAQELKGPISMLHMMGIILPILGLVILPLVVSFMGGVQWYHIAALYNITIPVTIYYMGKNILATRPTGYGDTDISENNPELKKQLSQKSFLGIKFRSSPAFTGLVIGIILFAIALFPFLMGLVTPEAVLLAEEPLLGIPDIYLLGYKESSMITGLIIGPYGMGASIISFLFPLSIALGLGVYYRMRSQNVYAIRQKSKKLEKEFASALFQLGNRLGDGIPSEIAFGRVASVMEGTVSGEFFRLVDMNIRKMGMGVKEAIFDERHGALTYYPSAIIESSMKVLMESAKKGPKIAAEALINVSRYIKEIHRVNERLYDLMSDIISDMRAQIKFMSPAISGIVIGITSMITNIIGKLSSQISDIGASAGPSAAGLSTMFGDGIPTYFFQAVVGVYVVQIVFVLTTLVNGIENGADKLNERYLLGQNLIKSALTYTFIALAVIVVFNLIANQIIGATLSTG